MRAVIYERLNPVLPDGDAMLRFAERFGTYGTYAVAASENGFATDLHPRHDSALHFVETGGRFGRQEDPKVLAARTHYFREDYASDDALTPGIEPFLHHAGFLEAARKVHRRPIVRPSRAYANFLVPGQELTVHTDVPEFRGLNRRKDPQWLIVAAHHSGLFDAFRIPIATGVAWFGHCRGGGEFAFYPEGAYGQPVALPARHNTAIVLDTDSVFHGVDRVTEEQLPLPQLRSGATLQFEGDGRWKVEVDGETLATYEWDDLCFSVSWGARCYESEAEERLVEEHTDDLTRTWVLETLEADLRKRGQLAARHPSENELARAIIDAYIQLPPVAPG